MYLWEPGSSVNPPGYQSLHRIEFPYTDPDKVLRAFVPQRSDLSGNTPPFGVSEKSFIAMAVDDRPVNTPNPYAANVYTLENNHLEPSTNFNEMDIFLVNFADPASPKWLRTYHSALLGVSVPSPIDNNPRLVDAAVLPAWTNNVYMGDGKFPDENWIALLFTYDLWGRWYIEIFDPNIADPSQPGWETPIYVIGPYLGIGRALDVDPVNFEIYVLSENSPIGVGNLVLSCFEYY